MKSVKNNLVTSIAAFGLCFGMLAFPSCKSGDSADPDTCEQLQCLNGGEKIVGVDGCHCDCPAGYSGENCEVKDAQCPVTVECPIGKTPNPDNGCACE